MSNYIKAMEVNNDPVCTVGKKGRHTPGPWKVVGTEIWAGSKRITIGRGSYDEKDREIRDANARLIAAAPDLFLALRTIANAKRKDGKYDKYDASGFVKIAEQAIAKAEKE